MVERFDLVRAWEAKVFSMEELCAAFGVSRKTAYKWISRYRGEGVEGLGDRSRAPHSCPHQTPEEVAEMIVEIRRAHSRWGPKKILEILGHLQPEIVLPAVSTAGEVLKRAGLVTRRRRRRRWPHPGRPLRTGQNPNDVWTLDFKGQFRLGDRSLCYPLTTQDRCSRFLIGCQALPSPTTQGVRESMERLFRECGLPEVIRTDNGEPFASHGLRGLTRLNVWWMRLGITHERIEKAHPEQNGAHERMHRELKAETARPPAYRLTSQQELFDRFRHEYNTERPHEGIGQRRPAEVWRRSTRAYPQVLKEPDYPGYFEVRRVRHTGEIKFRRHYPYLSESLAGQLVGLEAVDDGLWSIVFISTPIARLDERNGRVYG